jgi:hypothetical protein
MYRTISLILLAASCATPTILQGQVVFRDDFENGLAAWQATGSWGIAGTKYVSGTHSASDSPGAYYTNNTASALTQAAPVSFSGLSRPALAFQHAYFLEDGYDFGYVEISTNGGSTWIALAAGAYTGIKPDMGREQLDLSAYAGASSVRVRFRLVTDSSVVMDGWYIDDVVLGESPAPIALTATQTNRNSIQFAWTPTANTNFAAYRIYRSQTAGLDWRTAAVVAEATNLAAATATDLTTCPKTKYYYRLGVVNTNGLVTLGGEIPVSTPAGMDYPFVDNGEGGPTVWIADSPWALSTEDAFSATHAWSDSPGTNYASGIASQSLLLSAPLYLAGKAIAPALSFNHKLDLGSGDYANVEISLNSGADWTSLASYSGNTAGAWRRQRISLAAYTNATVLLRFRLTSDAANTPGDGWHIDDISVAESPSVVPAPVLDNVTSHSIRITWAPNTNLLFAYYAIFRATSSGVGITSTLAGIVSNATATSFTDTNLALDTAYYYRVYAVSPYGTFSPDSPLESTARSLNNPAPFSDGFEGGLANWNLIGSWGPTTNTPHSGLFTLCDSPQGNYTNSSDSYALTAVNLAGATWPVLRFWDRVRMSSGDWGRVEISPDGSTWTPVYGVSENQIRTNWAEQSIDLSPWKGQSNVRVRFHMWTDASGTEDGWAIDDLALAELTPLAIPYPFYEGFENGLTNWIHASWTTDTNSPYAGLCSVRDTVQTAVSPDTAHWLELAGPLNLSNAVSPQLTFWVRGHLGYYSGLRFQVSTDAGVSWTELSAANLDTGFNADWTRKQVALTAYTNQSVRVRFQSWSYYNSAPDEDLFIDKLAIAELPAPVVLQTTTPHLKTVDLQWSGSTLGAAFKRNEVYRATHANVTIADTLIGSFTSAASNTLTDTGLSIGTTYYYKIFTVDSNDTYTASNERMVTTVPLAFPVTDTLDTLGQWVTTGNWGIGGNGMRSGTGALMDSPAGDYANSSDTYALTAVNLAGTTWPVLRFWDRVRMSSGDWGRVEISPDGTTWTPVYGVSENQVRTNWAEQSIDLSPWKGQSNVRVRFHMWTDAGGTEDGWAIDDLTLAEHMPLAIPYPFYEGFENGLTNWLHASWVADTNSPFVGTNCARDTVQTSVAPDTAHWLELAGPLNLSNAVNPQLTFWVKGHLGYYSGMRFQVSTDEGVSWAEQGTVNLDTGFNADWTRKQVALTSYTNRSVRVRFQTWSYYGSAPDEDIFLDKITIAELPTPVVLESTTPHLKTADLQWSVSPLGAAFKRNEVYRATHANVTLADTLLGVFTNAASNTLTDTGLSIGATYYYKVFTVDTNDTYTPSNERVITTVPLAFPVADTLDTLGQWVTTGNWGIGSNGMRSGAGALMDSPSGDYANSSDAYALTAVNLSSATWPVLRFWDRVRMSSGDWGRVEISTDGGSWTPVYGISEYQIRTNWAEQSIDLSPWKGQSNVRIRFHLWTDGSGTEDGWAIDDLSLAEHTPLTIPYPFYEGFENGLTNWLHASWTTDTNAPYAGVLSVRDTVQTSVAPDTAHWLELAGNLNLTNAINPQLTFWVKGHLGYYSGLRFQVSTDGGVSWAEQGTVNLDTGFNADWTRKQVALTSYTNRSVRVRFQTWSYYGSAPDEDIFLDKISFQEAPPPVLLAPVGQATLSTLSLSWAASPLANFKEYRLYRSESSSVTESSLLIATITNQATTALVDSGLVSGKTYYYRIFVYDTWDTGTGGNTVSGMPDSQALPWSENFEGNCPGWTFSGAWTNWPAAGRNGGKGLVDSPSDYPNSSDTWAQFSVNLSGTDWPVLKFWDRHALADNDWGRLEISADAGASWTPLYGIAGTRTNWAEQNVDLSQWKNRSPIWLRFHVFTDGGTQNDGWYVDDVSVAENSARTISYPFYETFERGLTNWLHASWTVDTNAPYSGSYAVRDTVSPRIAPDTTLWLTLAGELNLSNAVNPQLTYMVRGYLGYYSGFRCQVSTDHGSNWTELSTLNLDTGFSADWTRKQLALTSYTNRVIRLRFQTWSYYGSAPDEDIFLDNVGIGEYTPSAPELNSPRDQGVVGVLRPTLVVNNAIDFQGNPLSYRFEVFADSALKSLVAQVPVVASGSNTTAWQVDVNLTDHAQYWWRCRAASDTNLGAWMTTASFYINHTNRAPLPVAIPDNVLAFSNLNGVLTWYPTIDPDPGDYVAGYQVQVDEDPNFGSPIIDQKDLAVTVQSNSSWLTISMGLTNFTGASRLVAGRSYFWRVRAADSYFALSDWPAGEHWFRLGMTLPEALALTAINPPDKQGRISLGWVATENRVYIERADSLTSTNWQTVAGPLSVHTWTFTNSPTKPTGFFRLRRE